ncbi:MAG: nucleotide exchange factor GrpE [Synechococcus sp.]
MTQEEKKPVPPNAAYPELEDDDELNEAELEELIQAVSEPEANGAVAQTSEDPKVAEVASLKGEVEALKHQLSEKDENYKRMYADFDNFRKRTAREKVELGERQKQKSILEILPIVDNFERAQQAIKVETDKENAIHESYQSVYRLLVESLKKMGVSRMKTVGESFNPNLHEAMLQQPSSDHSEGIILNEFQPGYLLGETVLRHAMVIVASAPEGVEHQPATADTEPEAVGESEDVNSTHEQG